MNRVKWKGINESEQLKIDGKTVVALEVPEETEKDEFIVQYGTSPP